MAEQKALHSSSSKRVAYRHCSDEIKQLIGHQEENVTSSVWLSKHMLISSSFTNTHYSYIRKMCHILTITLNFVIYMKFLIVINDKVLPMTIINFLIEKIIICVTFFLKYKIFDKIDIIKSLFYVIVKCAFSFISSLSSFSRVLKIWAWRHKTWKIS